MMFCHANCLLYDIVGVIVHIKTIQLIPQTLVFGLKCLVAFVKL